MDQSGSQERGTPLEGKKADALKTVNTKTAVYTDLTPIDPNNRELIHEGKAIHILAQRLIREKHDDASIDDVVAIIDGKLGGIAITEYYGSGFPAEDLKKRRRLLEIYEKDPELAKLIVRHRIAGFHGSASGSLPGFAESQGLEAEYFRLQSGKSVHTGERDVGIDQNNRTISFADWKDPSSLKRYAHPTWTPFTVAEIQKKIASSGAQIEAWKASDIPEELYSTLEEKKRDLEQLVSFLQNNAGTQEAKLVEANFPILYGVNVDGLPEVINGEADKAEEPSIIKRVGNNGVEGEFRVTKSVPHKRISLLAVREQEKALVRTFLDQHNLFHINVVNLEPLVASSF